MAISPQAVDLLIVAGFKAIELLGKISKGEEITDGDLNLESFETTLARVRAELKAQEGGQAG